MMTDLDPVDTGPPAWEQSLFEGDIVALGPSKALVFKVMAVRGDKAWVRGLDDGRDGVIDLASFRRFGLDAARNTAMNLVCARQRDGLPTR